ncbi:23S rRNA (pseudouridine(1915)-N(3))-methyltransferase RlmH [bacterium]|nr:23S rRNA (pseudouridine(1915)-N(3))-methyltransferase RlmH [bacterium]
MARKINIITVGKSHDAFLVDAIALYQKRLHAREAVSSEQFSKIVFDALASCNNIYFVIGGAHGVDERVRARANKIISFGSMVLPHQLMRLVLIEQLYRAATIASGGSYHHA